MSYDLLIKNGQIVDGSGRPRFQGDVGVKGGRVVEVGMLKGQAAKKTIDAGGNIVAPGFVDIHTHYDAQVLWDPLVSSSSWNGVTTCVMGNCGFTIAPCKPQDRDYIMRMLARVEGMSLAALQAGPEWTWTTMGEYIDRVGKKLAINVASQVGHSALRYWVMGVAATERKATDDEIKQMKLLLKKCVDEGATGFTTSKARTHVDWEGKPVPSRSSDHREVYELIQALGECNFGSVEMTPGSLPAIDAEERKWMIAMSRDSGRFINWNEFFQAAQAPEQWREVRDFMSDASKQGARIYGICACQPTDQEWDLKDNNLLLMVNQPWTTDLAKATEEKMIMFADKAYRDRVRATVDQSWDLKNPLAKWDVGFVARPKKAEHAKYKGMSLRELGRSQSKHPLDAMLDLAVSEGLDTGFIFKPIRNLDESALVGIMQSPNVILGISDAGAHVNMMSGAEYVPQVLGHWVREKGALTLEHAIYKMSWMVASLLGFYDRGLLYPGYCADINIIDASTVRPLPNEKVFDLPNGEERIVVHSKGIRSTVVNGQEIMRDGQPTGALPGKAIRSTDYRAKT